ncbi:ABC transporter permease [Nakamurella endophytica]|uniref:Ribose ABC transporter permease n=1 Tax=Nakamurella endophytica TaxID=1748367 RepID=A0A917WGC2_9ACTN|nr:ABC transporter permease [Nakamurella endophytica]GGM01796.1 ribose ABC transporter permease [Nakamurella endophytica]
MTTPPDISGRQPASSADDPVGTEVTAGATGGNPVPDGPAGGPVRRARRILPLLGSLQGYIGLVLIVLIGIGTQGGRFANVDNITNAIGYFAPRGILAVGMTLVIIAAGIDLSVGSLLAVGSTAAAWLLTDANWPVVAIVPACMVIGAVFGLANGAGTGLLRIQSFVMTLAMMTIARGIVREFSNNTSIGTVVIGSNGELAPGSAQFQKLGTPGARLFGGDVPLLGYFPVLALVVVVIVFQLVLTRTRFGRHVYAVGGNPTAARLSGVNVTAVTIAVFTLSGLLAGLAGPISAAYNASADPQAGLGYELDAIAAVVIGGASLAGGRGSVVGTFIGALILTLLDNVLGLNSVSANWQLIVKGLIVVVAVVIQRPELFSELAAWLRRTLHRSPAGAARG